MAPVPLLDLFQPDRSANGTNSSILYDSANGVHSNPRGSEEPSCWVFGYGSLCWYPGFEYEKCITGYIRGYVRRFWQGNVTHRGVPGKPGVVATLVEDPEGITWGCAYKITGNLALEYLKQRECTLGGYITEMTKFYPRLATQRSGSHGEPFPALLYIATAENEHWLGEMPEEILAKMISESHGPSGHNVEYLVRLAMFMRDELPGAEDEHLFTLEYLVKKYLIENSLSLAERMGAARPRIRRDSHENGNIARPITFEHTSRIPARKLRCLNI